MASLSIAVEAVDKRLERLRDVVPKSLDDVEDLLAQYHKASEVLKHAKKLAHPQVDLAQAAKTIDHRLDLIEKEQQKLVEWQLRNNNTRKNDITSSSNISNNSNNLATSALLSNSTSAMTPPTTPTKLNQSLGSQTTPSRSSPLKAVLTNRIGSKSSLQYQSWAGNLVYRRTPVTLPKMQRHIATHRSMIITSSKSLTSSGIKFFETRPDSPPETESESENESPILVRSTLSSSMPAPEDQISPLLLSTVITSHATHVPHRLSELQQAALRISELTAPAERKVQNEITDMISTKSAELYDLLWVVRQLDRAISRILNVQLDISELHTVLPNSTGLAVACVPQDVQESLRTVVSTLRTQPALLADTLLRAGYLAVDQDRSFKSTHYELSQAITFSLFGNCVNPADEKLFLYLLRRITKCQLSIAPTNHLFGKHESFALTLFSTYMNCTYGKPYLICAFKDLIASVLQEDSLNFESDPQKKPYLTHDSIPQFDPPRAPPRPSDDLPDNQMFLQHFAALFAKRITVRLTPLPYGIRWFAKSIIELWKARLAQPSRSPSSYRHSPTVTSTSSAQYQPPAFATSPTSPPPALTPSSVEWQLLCHVVIENIFVPTIIRPEHFGVAAGLPISHRRRSNLILIARMVLEFFTDPASIPSDLHHIINLDMIASYFAALTAVDDPDTHLRSEAQELSSVLISSTDLVLLLELVFQNQTCDSNFMKLVQVVQPAVAVLQEGMQFLVVEVGKDEKESLARNALQRMTSSQELAKQTEVQPQDPPASPPSNKSNGKPKEPIHHTPSRAHSRTQLAASSPLIHSPSLPSISMVNSAPTPSTPGIQTETSLVRSAKQNLRLALSVLDPICGPTYLPLNELLLLQCGRNLSFDAHVMEAHVSEIIRCLAALTPRYREDNYKLLLVDMFDDHATQQRALQERKQGLILHLNSTQRHIAQLQAQKRLNIELLTDIKFKQFRDKIYGRMQATFINEFHDACTVSGGHQHCVCYPSIHPNKNVICAKCKSKVERVKAFLARCRDALVGSIWWRHSSEEEIQTAMHTLERNLFIHIHAWVFSVSKEDEKFAQNLRKKSASISVNDVFISRKFHSQAPWALALEEIKKINIYKSPHDKVQSIIGCWNIIFMTLKAYTRPFGEDTGPDDYMPILAYVIIKAQPLHLLSNLQYILNYTELDPSDEVWVVNFLSAVELVREVTEGDLPHHGWTNGVVEHSFMFPSLPIPSERPRKLLHKHKTRHPKYGTL